MAKRPTPPSSSPSETKAQTKKGKSQKQNATAQESAAPEPTPDKKEINEEKKARRNLARVPVVGAEEITQSGRSGHNASPTVETVNNFLAALVDYAGNITRACQASGLSRFWLYDEAERNEEFAEKFRQAQAMGLDVMEDEARRRAFEGVERDVYYQGEIVGAERQYSDSLIVLLLKGGKPEKYKDRTEITGNTANPLAMEVGPTPLVMGFLEGLRGEEKK